MAEPAYRYVVIRAAADLPDGFLPPEWEGKWLDADVILPGVQPQVFGAVAVATDRFERRESDGATARVFEVRP
jgi:hypothetical protein